VASAESPAKSANPNVLEEVTVTAQRREEPLQTVPIAATVIGGAELERAQLHNLDALQVLVPNLTNAPSQTTRTSASFSLRGQYVRDTTPTIDPPVGLYLDGVYLSRMVGANLNLLDIDRVEVLRGPQGALFGRSTIGGAINLVSHAPEFSYQAMAKVTEGNYHLSEVTALVNLPLASDRVALRVAVSHTQHDGYARDRSLGVPLDDDGSNYLRAQLRFAPTSRSDLNLAFDDSRSATGSQRRVLLYVSPAAATLPAFFGNPTDTLSRYIDPTADSSLADRAGPVRTHVWGVSATLTQRFATVTLKAISAYRQLQADTYDSDQDGTPYDLGLIRYRGDRQHQIGQEVDLYSTTPSRPLEWIAGLHVFDERATFEQQFRVFVPSTLTWSENQPAGDTHNRSAAIFAQLSYALTPRLRATVGGRGTIDGRQLASRNARRIGNTTSCLLSPALLDQPDLCRATLPERDFRYVPWTAGLDYRPLAQTMVYAKLSRGYRSGGYNLRGTTEGDLISFGPERVTAWELGLKSELMERRVRLDLALFHSIFDDIQLTQRDAGTLGLPGVAYIANGGRAKIDGAELELLVLLGQLRLRGTLGLLRPAFTDLTPNIVEVTRASPFLNTPDTSASMAADWPVAIAHATLDLHVDYTWRSNTVFEYSQPALARQGAYGLLNVLLSTSFGSPRLQWSLWARNLTDRRYITRAFDNAYYVSATPGEPRTFGVSLSVRCVAH
jgi:iron complex outermembrane receptor protein